ncbi:MAG: TonB C-terminal domain-containing protein [Leptothrix sp. (in: b-proteobacteria)]
MSTPRDPAPLGADLDDPVRPAWQRLAIYVGAAVLMAAVAWWLKGYLGKGGPKKPGVQQIAILKQPPPPPLKPPEKPPEPPKVKEEVKLDQPKDVPRPDEPKQADDKPVAADKPLGVDADGAGGSDGFGLAANRGGRDITTVGPSIGGVAGGSIGAGRGAYYSGLLQRQFHEALTRSRKVNRDEFSVVVKIWLADDGRVTKADIVSGSGKPQVDELIQTTLLEMNPLRDVPPAAMRPIQMRLSNRS